MISDDTIREGLQTPGISFTVQEKLEIARIISDSGIKKALVSYPSAHKSEVEVTKEIVSKRYFNETYGLGRTLEKDIELIDSTGADISLHLPFSFEGTSDIMKAVRFAAGKGKRLEVAVVDVIKFSEDLLTKLCGELVEVGVNTIQLPDTTGMATPAKIGGIVSQIRNKFRDITIEVHCHNDSGLSVANAIAGLNAGADVVDTTIFGMGERNGITDQMILVDYLEKNGFKTGVDRNKLSKVYERVLQIILEKIGPEYFIESYPVVGKNVYIHTAGTHAAFSDVFHGEEFSVNVYTGRRMVKMILENSGIITTEDQLSAIVIAIKDRSVETGKALKTEDIKKIAGDVIG